MVKEEEDLLKRPVYVYDIPPELLETLTLRTDQPATPEEAQPTTSTTAPQDADTTSSTSCALCKITNKTVAEQRAHARSDIHNFNLKRKVRGQPAVTEAEFDDLLEGLNESISGSDSNSSEDESGPTDQLSALLKRNAVLANPDDEPTTTTAAGWKQGAGKAPIIWFNSPLLPAETSLGVYRALFTKPEQSDASWLDALRTKQLSAQPKGKEPHIFMCMIGGGHFAAMVVSLAPKVAKTGGERSAAILAHKTFHRYTTRRKQGGAQSASDAAKGAAHSAGSSLRRYNEVALTAEIRELLAGWKEWLDTADLLFVRAVGNSNRRTLFGEGAPLKSNDPRIRGFPFSTRRATESELMRCFVELTRMKTSTLTTTSLSALTTSTTTTAPPTAKPKPTPRLTPAEETAHLHSSQLTALIRRSKAPALLTYLTTHTLSPNYTFTPPNHHSPTLLHLAASSSSPAVVTALLTKARADPTLTTPAQPRPAFELAGDRATRDAFRVARHDLGEAAWDWEAAGVPAALSKSEAGERERREKEGGEAEERVRREREVARLAEEAERRAAESRRLPGRGGRNLGGTVQMGMGRREEQEAGLTKEGRMRLERERRARAAEERIRRLAGSG
ncbi:uncharacterized protein H6S33_006421 [Morchella sextelata]|uniref:uncharacterized protein n=1 Tax=Morchella sextelata TaxID=1174677 RepID=UPI001D04D75E|nr:uncharacterized protein H6S33_006421 [Morchella sextelata]KAH0604753.1 hypothetical protein H6S33_006421 [Morchella sextelata]